MQRRTRTGRQTPIAVSTCCGLLGMRRGLQHLRQRQHHSKLRKQDAQGRRPPTRAPPGSRRRGARPPRHRRSAAPEDASPELSCIVPPTSSLRHDHVIFPGRSTVRKKARALSLPAASATFKAQTGHGIATQACLRRGGAGATETWLQQPKRRLFRKLEHASTGKG